VTLAGTMSKVIRTQIGIYKEMLLGHEGTATASHINTAISKLERELLALSAPSPPATAAAAPGEKRGAGTMEKEEKKKSKSKKAEKVEIITVGDDSDDDGLPLPVMSPWGYPWDNRQGSLYLTAANRPRDKHDDGVGMLIYALCSRLLSGAVYARIVPLSAPCATHYLRTSVACMATGNIGGREGAKELADYLNKGGRCYNSKDISINPRESDATMVPRVLHNLPKLPKKRDMRGDTSVLNYVQVVDEPWGTMIYGRRFPDGRVEFARQALIGLGSKGKIMVAVLCLDDAKGNNSSSASVFARDRLGNWYREK
jgi:hypothetical protein